MATKKTKKRSKRISLKTFERKIRLRQLKLEDFDDLVAMQQRCFSGMTTWTRDQLASQLEIFPEGQLCVELEGEIVASASSLIVDYSEFDTWHDWTTIADDGHIRTHDPEGDTLYGIEIMVDPEYRNMKLARRLYEARKAIVREHNLKRIVIGGRIPGYGKHADEMSAQEYVERVGDKQFYDPVLTPQLANGFVVRGLIADYFPSDTESRGYATHLEWANLEHVPSGRKRRFYAVNQVRICALQYQLRAVRSFEQFSEQVKFFVDVASDYRSDFVVFPELFTLQLMSMVGSKRPAEATRMLAEFTPQYLELFSELAIKYHVNIVGGSIFSVEDDYLYNVGYIFKRDGTLGKQYRLHVTNDEKKWWGVHPGSKVNVFQTDRGKVAMLLGYDIEFPELARIALHKGAQILFVPFNTDERTGYTRIRVCAHARSIENDFYVVLAGCVGNLPTVQNADIHYAQSAIFTPADISFPRDGIAAESTPNVEHVLLQDLDLELLRRHAFMGSVQSWNNRNTEMYRVHYQEGGETQVV